MVWIVLSNILAFNSTNSPYALNILCLLKWLIVYHHLKSHSKCVESWKDLSQNSMKAKQSYQGVLCADNTLLNIILEVYCPHIISMLFRGI